MKKIILPLTAIILCHTIYAQKHKITFEDAKGIMAAQPYGILRS
jgi:hypothetical protein